MVVVEVAGHTDTVVVEVVVVVTSAGSWAGPSMTRTARLAKIRHTTTTVLALTGHLIDLPILRFAFMLDITLTDLVPSAVTIISLVQRSGNRSDLDSLVRWTDEREGSDDWHRDHACQDHDRTASREKQERARQLTSH